MRDRRSSSTDELGNTTHQTYDQLGRVAKTTAPNDGATTTQYDLDGNPTSVTGPTGATAQATYDFLGRKATSTQLPQASGDALVTTYSYDTAGRLKSQATPNGVATSYT